MAEQSNSRSRPWASCPDLGTGGRMNRGQFHVSFPWSVSAGNIRAVWHRQRVQGDQRTPRCVPRFLNEISRQLLAPGTVGMSQEIQPHRLSMTSYPNRLREASTSRLAEVDRFLSSAFR